MQGCFGDADSCGLRRRSSPGRGCRRFGALLALFALLFSLLPVELNLVSAGVVNSGSDPGAGMGLDFKSTPSMIIEDNPLGSEGSDAITRALKSAIATQPKSITASGLSQASVVMQEIHYEMPQAGEVFLLWGVNGWQPVPEAARLPGTVMKDNGNMATVMKRTGDTFVARVQVPAGSVVDFNFWISKARDGAEVQVWDANGYPPRDYHTIARADRPAVVLATLDLEKARADAKRTYAPLVTQEVRYRVDGPAEVSLIWGINGWQPVPEVNRPPGTVIKDGRMHTPMRQERDVFIAKLEVPSSTVIDYRFLITPTSSDTKGKILDSIGDFRQTATTNGVIDVNVKEVAKQDAIQTQPPGTVSGSSTATRYGLILAVVAFSIITFLILFKRRLFQSTLLSTFVSVLKMHRR